MKEKDAPLLMGVGMAAQSFQNADPPVIRDGFTQLMLMEYEKGVRAGMLTIVNLPQNVLTYAETMIPDLKGQILDIEGEEKDDE